MCINSVSPFNQQSWYFWNPYFINEETDHGEAKEIKYNAQDQGEEGLPQALASLVPETVPRLLLLTAPKCGSAGKGSAYSKILTANVELPWEWLSITLTSSQS